MHKIGEVNWSDVGSNTQNVAKGKDLFLKLEQGANEVRIVTQPYQYYVHSYKKDEKDTMGQKVNCSIASGSCPLCEAGDKPKRRWFLGVISRKTQTYKILDVSGMIMTNIKSLSESPKWGNPMSYDVDIIVDKNGGVTGYYKVQPNPKEPLSAADQAIKDSVNLEDLTRRVTTTPEMVQKRLDKILGVENAVPKAPSVKTEEDDGDTEFPAYDSK